MKGIYLTQEGKEDIEAKIAELESIKLKLFQTRKEYYEKNKDSEFLREFMSSNSEVHSRILFEIKLYKEILSSAIILPVEDETFYEDKLMGRIINGNFDTTERTYLQQYYPNGVIITPKQ